MQNDPSVDAIIARAHDEVAARREAEARQAWGGARQKIFPGVVLAVLVAFLLTPGALPTKLLLAMGGVCGLRPAHSYFAGGVQLPMEARMVGIFAGFSITLITLLAFGRAGARRLGSRVSVALLTLFFAAMALDGINSTLYEFALPHLYAPSNPLRLITGLLSGVAIAPFLLWFLNWVALPNIESEARSVVGASWESIAILAPIGLFAALVMSESAAAYAPAAFLSVVGIVLVMAMVTLTVLVHSSPLRGRVDRWHMLVSPGAFALLTSFGFLAVSAYMRWT